MNTKNDIIVIRVRELEEHRQYFRNLQFEVTDISDTQFVARFNDKLVSVIQAPMKIREHRETQGNGIEVWLSVEDIKSHYEQAKAAGVKITIDFDNRGYGPVGDYGTMSPEGFQFFFSQPKP
jgi:uncharacterized glyoxalase superfamily protein PhnB